MRAVAEIDTALESERIDNWLTFVANAENQGVGVVSFRSEVSTRVNLERLLPLLFGRAGRLLNGACILVLEQCLSSRDGVESVRFILEQSSIQDLTGLRDVLWNHTNGSVVAMIVLATSSQRFRSCGVDPKDLAKMLIDADDGSLPLHALRWICEWSVSLNPEFSDFTFWRTVVELILNGAEFASATAYLVSSHALEEYSAVELPDILSMEVALSLPLEDVGTSWPE